MSSGLGGEPSSQHSKHYIVGKGSIPYPGGLLINTYNVVELGD